MRHFTEYPPLSLYVHYPWCVRKCPYCDFNSHAVRGDIPERDYLNALVADLEQHAPDIWGRSVETIFFGGGTPSLMSAEGLDFLLGKIRAIVKLEPLAEITLEANPGTTEQSRFESYRQAGINRLSIGVQTFNADQLNVLGRIHSGDEAAQACESAAKAGFDNFNIDLMHGLPDQSEDDAADDIRRAIALSPSHLSYYQLTLEPNTLFAARPPHLPDEDKLAAIQSVGQRMITEAGYEQYEVSAYAQANRRCQHNLNYWTFGDYLGIGAGAHSKLSFPANNLIVRHSKHKHPEKYLQTAHSPERIQASHNVSEAEARFEFMMNALRLNDGFTPLQFEQCTGETLHPLTKTLVEVERDGLLQRDTNRIAATPLGLQFLDTLLERFMERDSHKADGGLASVNIIEIKRDS